MPTFRFALQPYLFKVLLGQLVSFKCLVELLIPVVLLPLFKSSDCLFVLKELTLDITDFFISLEYLREKLVRVAYVDLHSRLIKSSL